MRLAGEHEQNLWKERSCGQNLDNVRLSGTKFRSPTQRATYLYAASRGVRSREKSSSRVYVLSFEIRFSVLVSVSGIEEGQTVGEGFSVSCRRVPSPNAPGERDLLAAIGFKN